jgi:hypothetical protein
MENHAAMVAVYFTDDSFDRVQQTIRVTAATEADITNHGWSIWEILALVE